MVVMRNHRRLTVSLLVTALVASLAQPGLAALISTSQEIQIGRQAAREVEAEYGLVSNAAWVSKLATIGRRLAAVSSRRDLPWTFKVLNASDVNAISLPGGVIYVTRGMMNFVRSDDELAFVLGHEVGTWTAATTSV